MFEKYINKPCDVQIMFGCFPSSNAYSPLTVSGRLIAADNEFIYLQSKDYKTKKNRESVISIKNILAFHSYEE